MTPPLKLYRLPFTARGNYAPLWLCAGRPERAPARSMTGAVRGSRPAPLRPDGIAITNCHVLLCS